MLITFKVSNFLSFSEEQSISMIPSTSENQDLIKIDQIELLRKGVIFGANSSGKSNFIKALAFGKELVLEGFLNKHRNLYSKTLIDNKGKESKFEYTFYMNGKFYSFGFSFILYEGRFTNEFLYEINGDDEEILIFSRNQKEFVWNIVPEAEMEEYKRILKEKPDCLFINLIASAIGFKNLRDVYCWFRDKLIVNFQNQEFLRLESGFIKSQDSFVKMLKAYDTGISEIRFRKIELDSLRKHGEDMYKRILSEMARGHSPFGIRLKDALYNFLNLDGDFEVFELYLRHQNSELDYEFKEESDGTRRMFDLLDIIISPIPYAIYLIDEINRSIHPLLTEKFLLTYKNTLKENFVQLIFTTHEANLLHEELLRRDEVWFVEKQADNSSRIFSLDIFQKENEKDLGKAYLAGRYGGIPLLNKSGDN
jgi:hypothetical protein